MGTALETRLTGIMENDPQCVTPAAMHGAHAVAHGDFACAAAFAGCGSVVDGEDKRIALLQRNYLGTLAGCGGFRHDELAARKIAIRCRQ